MSDKKQLLNEALKRHKQILEYNFYIGEEGDSVDKDAEKLIFGSADLTEQDEDPFAAADTGGEIEEPAAEDDLGAMPGTEEPAAEDDLGAMPGTEEPAAEGGETSADPFGSDAPVEDEIAEEPMDDEGQVEVDVTDIVDKAEEAKEEASQASSKIDDLLGKFGELEQKLGGMDAIISKMDELEKEVIQRNPTPTEKLNMRSLDSFPYSVKLTDFWAQKEGYDTGGEEEQDEYVLTQGEIEDDYSESDIKDSFKLGKKEE